MLTKNETLILDIISKSKEPLSIGEIRNQSILGQRKNIVAQDLLNKIKKLENRNLARYVFITELNRLYSKNNISTLGESTIVTCLYNLEKMKIIISRDLHGYRAKKVYALRTKQSKNV